MSPRKISRRDRLTDHSLDSSSDSSSDAVTACSMAVVWGICIERTE